MKSFATNCCYTKYLISNMTSEWFCYQPSKRLRFNFAVPRFYILGSLFVLIFGTTSGSQLWQNSWIIKQTVVLLWKFWRNYGSVSYLFSCISICASAHLGWPRVLFSKKKWMFMKQNSMFKMYFLPILLN